MYRRLWWRREHWKDIVFMMVDFVSYTSLTHATPTSAKRLKMNNDRSRDYSLTNPDVVMTPPSGPNPYDEPQGGWAQSGGGQGQNPYMAPPHHYGYGRGPTH